MAETRMAGAASTKNAMADVALALGGLAPAARTGEVRVLSPSAVHSSLEALIEAHRKQSGDEVRLTFETAPALRKRLAADPLNPDGARAFLRFLGSSAAKAILVANGVER